MSREKDHFALKNFLSTKIGNKKYYHYEHPTDKSFKWEGEAWDKNHARSKALDAYEDHKSIKEDAPANSAGGGNIAGIGVGPKGEPGRPAQMMPMLRRGKFAGKQTFIVSSKMFHTGRLSKKKGQHWSKYFEEAEGFGEIREYARKNPKKSIILQDENTGALYVARYGGQV